MAGQTLLTNLVGLICVFLMGYLKIQNIVSCIIFGAARFHPVSVIQFSKPKVSGANK